MKLSNLDLRLIFFSVYECCINNIEILKNCFIDIFNI